ncbi:MAG: isochorismatase family protein [Planctomycetes bacterium]|nr:isochorismatase family protein [Planctomycetota bacterium]
MSSTDVVRSSELLNRSSSRLLVVDVQEKLTAAMPPDVQKNLINSCRFLIEGARLLNVPVTVTEQYPQGLGPSVSAIADLASERLAKKRFSAFECTTWPTAASAPDDRFQIVVAGMETHVCVLQTVLDLLAAGYQAFVAVDSVASRYSVDHKTGLKRMANAGATLVTSESVLFEWCETADATEFKQVSSLIKQRKRETQGPE